MPRTRFAFTGSLFILCASIIPGLCAEEAPFSQKLIQGMRERGYLDTANEYLDELERKTPLVPELILERAYILRDLARSQLLPAEYEATQRQAREAFQKFVQQNPNDSAVPDALVEIAQLRQLEIKALLLKIRRASQGDMRQQLISEFRMLVAESRQEFRETASQLTSRLAKFPKFIDQAEAPEQFEARRKTETALVNLRLQTAILLYDEGEVASSGEERKKLTQDAFGQFEKLQEEYRTNLVGIYSRLYQGRCYQRLGKPREALGMLQELILLRAEDPQVQGIINEARLSRLQVWSEEGNDRKTGAEKLQQVIRDANDWLKEAPQIQRTRIGQGVRWELARAYERLGEFHAPTEESREGEYERALAVSQVLSQQPGEWQQQAAVMSTRLAQRLGRDLAAAKDFTAAFFECMNRIKELEALQEGIEQAEGDDELKQLQADLALRRPTVITQLTQTLALVRPDTPPDDVARVRYWLCYLYFLSGRDYESIVIGEFIGRTYADNEQFKTIALESSFMALLAYAQAYQKAPTDSRQFEVQGMTSLCEFLVQKWPKDPKTQDAVLTLGRIYTDQNQPEIAVQWFEKISDQFPQYLDAQLSAATAYWNAYLRALSSASQHPGGSAQPLTPPISEYPQLAHSKLIAGIRKAESDKAIGTAQSPTLLLARLTLAQIENHQGHYQEARDALLGNAEALIPQLKTHAPEDRPKTGPFSMAFLVEAHRQWLRSAIGLGNLEDALEALEALGQMEGGTGKAADLYVAVGEQFASELKQWRDRDQRKYHETLTSFESFLTQLSERPEARTPRTLFWIGESWLNLADNQSSSSVALPYLERGTRSFDALLQLAQEKPDAVPAELVQAARFRRVVSLRRSGKFETALEGLRELLQTRPNAMDLQIEGARLMGDWARTGGAQASEHWTVTLQGEAETVVPRLWGWGEIANRFRNEIARQPESSRLMEQYLESRLAIADTRYQSALTPSLDSSEKQSRLTRAAADVQFVLASQELKDPWLGKFNHLWQSIHTSLGVPTPRLTSIQDPVADSSPVETNPPGVGLPPEGTADATAARPPSKSSEPLLSLPIAIFAGIALLAILVTVYLNRPRKRSSRRIQRSSLPRNLP